MARESRSKTPDLTWLEALRDQPSYFDFYQAVRRLENYYSDYPRMGEAKSPSNELLRLGQKPSVRFAPAIVESFIPAEGGKPARLASYFLGLFGPNGPLPIHLTEYARSRERFDDDPTFRRFADVFHHRMLALFYRAWANAQPTVSFDRPKLDRFGAFIAALGGVGMPSLQNRDTMPDRTKRHFVGRLACHTRNAEGLEAIVRGFFGLLVLVEMFVGHWMNLPDSSRLLLGRAPANALLGQTSTIGTKVWDCQYKFRLILGPLDLTEYERFLPGNPSLKRLVAVVRNYVGDELFWDVNLILRQSDVPQTQLGGRGRLGWTSWLLSDKAVGDRNDLFLYAEKYENGIA